MENPIIPKQSWLDFTWQYFSLTKQQQDLSKAIALANKKAVAYNKQYYVFRWENGMFYVLNRIEIEDMKKKGVFSYAFTYDKMIERKLHIAIPPKPGEKVNKITTWKRIINWFTTK
jgi:hypothetical protein